MNALVSIQYTEPVCRFIPSIVNKFFIISSIGKVVYFIVGFGSSENRDVRNKRVLNHFLLLKIYIFKILWNHFLHYTSNVLKYWPPSADKPSLSAKYNFNLKNNVILWSRLPFRLFSSTGCLA